MAWNGIMVYLNCLNIKERVLFSQDDRRHSGSSWCRLSQNRDKFWDCLFSKRQNQTHAMFVRTSPG